MLRISCPGYMFGDYHEICSVYPGYVKNFLVGVPRGMIRI